MPVLRALDRVRRSGAGDPIAALDAARRGGAVAIAYAAEHRALIALATGRTAEGVAAIRRRPARQRRGAHRGCGWRRRRRWPRRATGRAALAMLDGDDPTLVAARADRSSAGKPLPGAVDGAATGIAELLARVAIDINRERVTPISLTLARLATFLAPGNARDLAGDRRDIARRRAI